MKDFNEFGSVIKNYVEELAEDFIECAYFIDIIYELLDEYGLQSPREEDFIYSDDQIDVLLKLIVANKDLSDSALGKLVVNNL
ncbi:hypothetical protein UFOVP54_112 [uncultured Caudovirales phage]|uniref:Uncharacterized protein n=1 Tax=uncultured Caudovirales phage TaxID=2100421 RepID=A0A6J5KTV1_9CAUD|nr:hypothetical protein UFOVP54_112 [uncultured Caudovirales phage]